METTTKKQIIEALQEYMKEHSINQSEIAHKCNVPAEYLSIMLQPNSKFEYSAGQNKKGFISVKYFNQIASFIGFSIRKEYWQVQPTPQISSMLANLQEAKDNHITLTLIGQTGSGKTFASELFKKRNPKDVFMIKAGSSDTLNDLIDKLVDETKVQTTGQSKSSKLRAISQKFESLKNLGYKPALIVDESEYLNVFALCAFKELYDHVHQFASIIFVGTHQFVNKMDMLLRRNKVGIKQFHRRIKFGLRLLPAIDKDYSVFFQDLEDRELKEFLLRNCDNYGELHDVLEPSLREADRMGQPLTLELVRKVINLPVGDMQWIA